VYIFDGATVSMPDTYANQQAYPQPPQQKPGLGFPLMRIAAIFSLACGAVLASSVFIYRQLESDFLPTFDEGGFIIDFWAPPGTSLTETSRQLAAVENILSANPDVPGYARVHFSLALVSSLAVTAIFSRISAQVLRTCAVTNEQFSI